MSTTSGLAAGVPFLAVPPDSGDASRAPVVIAWHLMDAPRTETAFAAALPLEGLPAWRLYFGLPMFSSRTPAGGFDEIMGLAADDAVLKLHGPVVEQAAAEFPAAFAHLRGELSLRSGPVGLVGGSMGSAVASLVMTEVAPTLGLPVAAAVLISPVARFRPVVDAISRQFGMTYPWGPEALALAERLDFAARAEEIAATGQPAVRLIVGADDDADGFRKPSEELRSALAEHYDDPSRADLVVIPGMGHALAEEPGLDPAPQTPSAAAVDRAATTWLRTHLP